jgi:hypothetical protein
VQRQRTLPRPALRWVAEGRVALRAFDFDADADAVCTFQPETYGLNFPDFEYSASFAGAFRHDLRRAALDSHNALLSSMMAAKRKRATAKIGAVICSDFCGSWSVRTTGRASATATSTISLWLRTGAAKGWAAS